MHLPVPISFATSRIFVTNCSLYIWTVRPLLSDKIIIEGSVDQILSAGEAEADLGCSNGLWIWQLQGDLRDSFRRQADHPGWWNGGPAPIGVPEAIGITGVFLAAFQHRLIIAIWPLPPCRSHGSWHINSPAWKEPSRPHRI